MVKVPTASSGIPALLQKHPTTFVTELAAESASASTFLERERPPKSHTYVFLMCQTP